MSINQFLKPLFQGDQVKDYKHASKIFLDGGLQPKHSFLYHVAFDFGQVSKVKNQQQLEIGLMVKEVTLPGFKLGVQKKNAYNRWDYAQTKIDYDDVRITFHDDSQDVVREFWYDYYSYFYRDSDYEDPLYRAGHKYQSLQSNVWGYTPRDYQRLGQTEKLQYLNAIRIYSLHQKEFSEYTLINPIISGFKHGEHRASDGSEVMQHEMTVQYEAVKYRKGYVTADNVKGFGKLHYDNTPSPLTPAGGGTNSIAGPGGLLQTADEIVKDLSEGNIGSALFKGGRALNNLSNLDLKAVASAEIGSIAKDILRGQNPLDRLSIPSINGVNVGQTIANGVQEISNTVSNGFKTIGGQSPAVSSNGSLLSSASSFADDAQAALSNTNFSLPSVTNFSTSVPQAKLKESNIRQRIQTNNFSGADFEEAEFDIELNDGVT